MDTTRTLHEWDLYHSYGKFNINFERIIDSVRNAIIVLILINYKIPIIEEELPESSVDRPLQLILSEATSSSLIKYFRGLLFESKAQNIFNYSENQVKLLSLLYTKLNEANELRNKIIHSTSHIWNVPDLFGASDDNSPSNKPLNFSISLFSKMVKVTKDGYNYKSALYKVQDFDKYNEELETLSFCLHKVHQSFFTY